METSIIIKEENKIDIERSMSIKIKKVEDLVSATILLSNLNVMNDRIVTEEERITKPARELIKAEKSRWAVIRGQIEASITHIRTEMSLFRNLQKIKEQKIADRVSKGTMKIETAVSKLSTLNQEVAGLKFREMQVLRITNVALLPRQYLVPDEKKILEDLKSGKPIKGAEIEIRQVPVNSRN